MKKLYITLTVILYSCGGGGGSSSEPNVIQNSPPSIDNNTFTYEAIENQTQAFAINASDPVLISLDLLPLIKPPTKDVNNCFVSEKK